jgi:hypothetical protein
MRPLTSSMLVGLAVAGAVIGGVEGAGAATSRWPLYAGRPAIPSAAIVVALSSDVRIEQAKGRVRAGKLPEAGNEKKSAASAGADANRPITCDPSNATSQGCYTATQQYRPAGAK